MSDHVLSGLQLCSYGRNCKTASLAPLSFLQESGIEDSTGLILLRTALEAFDRMRDAQREIKERGLLLTDRFGQFVANPACVIEKAARGQMLQALKQLDLSIELPASKLGRPAGSGGYHR